MKFNKGTGYYNPDDSISGVKVVAKNHLDSLRDDVNSLIDGAVMNAGREGDNAGLAALAKAIQYLAEVYREKNLRI